MEEGSPMIAPGNSLRYSFTPKPSGTRWYHTHATAFANLALGTYSGQFGFLLIEGKGEPGHYDQEINLAIHHWGPSFVPMVETMRMQSANAPLTTGSDVGYIGTRPSMPTCSALANRFASNKDSESCSGS